MPNLLTPTTTTVPYSIQTFNVTSVIILSKQKMALRFTEKSTPMERATMPNLLTTTAVP